MSHIDVHEIKLNLRYPNSRQEDITDAFMRGYQGAVKIGNDAVRRVKAEKTALERRIDELCQENERLRKAKDTMRSDAFEIGTMLVKARDENAKLRADQAHWELGNCPSCPNIADLQEALEQNAKLCAEVEALKRDEWSAGFSAGCEAVEAAYEDGEAHYEAENVKLREQVEYMTPIALYAASEQERDRMRELGIEVG